LRRPAFLAARLGIRYSRSVDVARGTRLSSLLRHIGSELEVEPDRFADEYLFRSPDRTIAHLEERRA
jgi:hypothetical protein